MILEQRINALATSIGADVKALRLADGDLTLLSTSTKFNLVSAINEVLALANIGASLISDVASTSVTNKTYSASKISTDIATSISALRNELRAGASAALDTFAEVAAQLAADEGVATALATAINNRVRFDAATTLTTVQQDQARSNINAASASLLTSVASDLSTLTSNIGDTSTDFVAVYSAARA